MENGMVESINEKCAKIDTEKLLNDIRIFRAVDFKRAKEIDIVNILKEIILFDIKLIYTYDSNSSFYRARKIVNNKLLTDRSDIWYRPAKDVTQLQRLNDVNQSILYTSAQPYCLPDELRLTLDDMFSLIKYKVKPIEKLEIVAIGMDDMDHSSSIRTDYFIKVRESLDKKAKNNYDIITDFLKTEFTRDVGVGTEFLYKISVIICKYFFDKPNIDGFLYPSVSSKLGYNVALKQSAVDRAIEFEGLKVFKLVGDPRDNDIFLTSVNNKYWSNEIVGDKIIYETDKPCPITFSGLKYVSFSSQ